jgi:hypothetical protein
MPTREHGRAQRSDAMSPAARAFLSLSGDGTAELDSRSTRKSVAALAIMFLVLLAAPLYWASHSQAKATDQPLAVKHDGGSNSGPGGGDDDDDDHGDDDNNNDDNPNATHQGNTGPGASELGGINDDNGDDNPNATHQGNTGPGASEHGGHHHGNGGSDDDAHHTVNANETQGPVGTTQGDG